MDQARGDGESCDDVEIFVAAQCARRGKPRVDERAVPHVMEQTGQLEGLVVREAIRRLPRNDPGDIGGAAQHHLRLLGETFAELAVSIDLDRDDALPLRIDCVNERLDAVAKNVRRLRSEKCEFQFDRLGEGRQGGRKRKQSGNARSGYGHVARRDGGGRVHCGVSFRSLASSVVTRSRSSRLWGLSAAQSRSTDDSMSRMVTRSDAVGSASMRRGLALSFSSTSLFLAAAHAAARSARRSPLNLRMISCAGAGRLANLSRFITSATGAPPSSMR